MTSTKGVISGAGTADLSGKPRFATVSVGFMLLNLLFIFCVFGKPFFFFFFFFAGQCIGYRWS